MILYWILTVIHVVVAILLVTVVLMQAGRGGGLSGAFGGGGATQTMFGGRGAGDVMTRTTQVMGATFMISSLSLVLLAGRTSQTGLSEESQRFMDDIRQTIQQQQQAPPAGDPFGVADDGQFTLPPVESAGGEAPAAETPAGDGDAATSGADGP